ncbi:MAG: YdcF family protein, partial [Deltaproteobacteria bacterium]|nr:YdcF family protein [Deltaproteobacteria bacterium]
MIFNRTEDLPQVPTALVLGAALWGNQPSPVLQDRLESALDLYQQQKVSTLFMSGAKWGEKNNEPEIMEQQALAKGVPAQSILKDEQGFRTYASCQRAKEIYQINEVIIVTQRFHLPRSLFLCEKMGLRAWGFEADRRDYSFKNRIKWKLREALASWGALVDVVLMHFQHTRSS